VAAIERTPETFKNGHILSTFSPCRVARHRIGAKRISTLLTIFTAPSGPDYTPADLCEKHSEDRRNAISPHTICTAGIMSSDSELMRIGQSRTCDLLCVMQAGAAELRDGRLAGPRHEGRIQRQNGPSSNSAMRFPRTPERVICQTAARLSLLTAGVKQLGSPRGVV
jgi:hypothetical protein